MTHELKCETRYFRDVQAGLKRFEIRKNDRGFQVGDTLILKEWRTEEGQAGSFDMFNRPRAR